MKYIFGNWKMYLDVKESVELAKKIVEFDDTSPDFKIAIFPTALSFVSVFEAVKDSRIDVGAQNVAWVTKGAYTGAVSALLYKEAGASHALIGHSERRHIFGEGNTEVRKKLEACLDIGTVPVVCIGETKEDRDEDKRTYRLKKQINIAFEGLDMSIHDCIVSYEPVWAIGTGHPCLPADAEDIIGWVKMELKKYGGDNIPVLYGGSVSADNIVSYISEESIDGVLVGGSSAKYESFKALVEVAQKG